MRSIWVRNTLTAVVRALANNARSFAERHGYDMDGGWAVRPLEILCERGRTMPALEDSGGEPLDRLIGPPMEVGWFLRLAIRVAMALGKVYQRSPVILPAAGRRELRVITAASQRSG